MHIIRPSVFKLNLIFTVNTGNSLEQLGYFLLTGVLHKWPFKTPVYFYLYFYEKSEHYVNDISSYISLTMPSLVGMKGLWSEV